jgi:hypothetical protein
MMDKLAVDIAGVHLAWQMLLAGIVAAQWVVIALVSLIAPVRMKKTLGISTAIFAAGWLFAFDASSLFASKTEAAEASSVGVTAHKGSCALLRNNMSAADVRAKLGQPDEVRNEDTVRGPGSVAMIYRDIRCAVHLFDDRVELVD